MCWIFTETHRKKISKAARESYENGRDGPNKGKILSEETKHKLSETRKKLYGDGVLIPMTGEDNPMWNKGYLQIGELNPNWQGGLSDDSYGPEFNNTLKSLMRKRDDFTCQLCGLKENGRHLDVHHIDSDKENSAPSNLVCLCSCCHNKTKKKSDRDYWYSYFVHKQIDVLLHG